MKIALVICLMLGTIALADALPFWYWCVIFFRQWIPFNTDVDVMMLLDSSGQGNVNFNRGKKGVQNWNLMVDFRTPSGITGLTDGTRSGFIQFSSLPKTDIKIHLPDFQNVYNLNNGIKTQAYDPGSGQRETLKALELASDEFFTINRNSRREKRILLVTDGNISHKNRVVALVRKLKKRGVEICIVTIGNKANLYLYKNLASKYSPMFYKGHPRPCVIKAESWIEFNRGSSKAWRYLRGN